MAKKAIIVFLTVSLLGIALFGLLNYLVDPYYFYRFRSGEIRELPRQDEEINQRMMVVYDLKNSPVGTYEGLVVGGSKSWPVSTALLKHYTGYDFLHCGVVNGKFDWYEGVIKYAVKHQKIKYVLLHLSGCETYIDEATLNEARRMPALLSVETDIRDVGHFLFVDLRSTLKDFHKKGFRREALKPQVDGLRPYLGLDAEKLDQWIVDARLESASKRLLIDYYKTMISKRLDPMLYAQKYVLDMEIPYTNKLERLFHENPTVPYLRQNLEAMKRIKEFCDANNVELKVVVGAVHMAERYKYEGFEYWDFLLRLADIVDYYDFSYFCDINDNPLNFWNERHNIDTITWVMICSIYGYDPYHFGRHVTKANVAKYLMEREQDYFVRAKEYASTGTVKLPGMGEKGDLSRLPKTFLNGLK